MLDWLGDVPDPVWAAVATGAFLLGQQVISSRREDKREKARTEQEEARWDREAADRERERQHQLALAEQARSDARAEVWRIERREAHTAMLSLAQEAVADMLEIVLIKVGPDSDGVAAPNQGFTVQHESARDAIRDACAVVEILGSEASRAAAMEVHSSIVDVHFKFWLLSSAADPTLRGLWTKMLNYDAIKDEVHEAQRKLNTYRQTIRQDLGTAD